MNSKIKQIVFNRKSKMVVEAGKELIWTPAMVGAVIANIGVFGYMPDSKLVSRLQTLSDDQLVEFHTNAINFIKEALGATWEQPMYPNFPQQVADCTESELYINAIMHYFGDVIGERILPDYEKLERFPLWEPTEFKWIGVADESIYEETFMELMESVTSPSMQDCLDIKAFVEAEVIPSRTPEITNKEKLVKVYAIVSKATSMHFIPLKLEIRKQFKTATDVLRLATAVCDGDVSLAEKTKFKSFTRPGRRDIMALLGQVSCSLAEDMQRHRMAWIRLSEKLHIGEYAKQYPQVYEAITQLRKDEVVTFNSKVETSLKNNDNFQECISLLRTRPGDYARRLNKILSETKSPNYVLNEFEAVAENVSTTVLWQLFGYFKGRNSIVNYNNRIFLPKKNISALVAKNTLQPISEDVRKKALIKIRTILKEKYLSASLATNDKDQLVGKAVYIDPSASKLLIPSGNRTASNALRQVGRGSRFDLANTTNTVRLFVYWKNQNNTDDYYDRGRVDLDLSGVMFDENWRYIDHCSYTNLRSGQGLECAMAHSGDITSAPEGASEFIDINLTKLDPKVRYITMNVNCFTGQPFNKLDVAFCGWMNRAYPNSGEIYEPKTVEGKADLTSDTVGTSPMVLDVKTRQIIWTDIPNCIGGVFSRVETTMDKTVAAAALASRKQESSATLMDLFEVVIQARGGSIVSNRDFADVVIAEDGDISPFDLNKIMSDFM